MHPSQLAARRQLAEDRIDAVISQLAERAGVAVPVQEPVRDHAVRDLYRLEALADAIEAIAAALPETSNTPPHSSQGEPRVGELTVAQVTDEVATITDLIDLEAMLSAEREGKDRAGAVRAIEARIDELRGT